MAVASTVGPRVSTATKILGCVQILKMSKQERQVRAMPYMVALAGVTTSPVGALDSIENRHLC